MTHVGVYESVGPNGCEWPKYRCSMYTIIAFMDLATTLVYEYA